MRRVLLAALLAASLLPGAARAGYRVISVGRMVVPRRAHTATLLPDGRVLIAGGSAHPLSVPIRSTEIFDPASRTFTRGPDMNVAREQHAALLMPSGKVLVAGGSTLSYVLMTPSTELIDPDGACVRLGDMLLPRGRGLVLALTQDGSAWALGGPHEGRFGEVSELIERLPPGLATWLPAGHLTLPCDGVWSELEPGRLLQSAGGKARSSPDGLQEACEAWGEEITLAGGRASGPLVRMNQKSSIHAAAALSPSLVVTTHEQGLAFLERRESWELQSVMPLDSFSPAICQAIVAWGDSELVVLLDGSVRVVDWRSRRELFGQVIDPGIADEVRAYFQRQGLDLTTLESGAPRVATVLSRDEVLLSGGVLSSRVTAEPRAFDSMLLVRDPPSARSQPSPPSASASVPKP